MTTLRVKIAFSLLMTTAVSVNVNAMDRAALDERYESFGQFSLDGLEQGVGAVVGAIVVEPVATPVDDSLLSSGEFGDFQSAVVKLTSSEFDDFQSEVANVTIDTETTNGRPLKEILRDVGELYNFTLNAEVLYGYYTDFKIKESVRDNSLTLLEATKCNLIFRSNQLQEAYNETMKRLSAKDDLPRVEGLLTEMLSHNEDGLFNDAIEELSKRIGQLHMIEDADAIRAVFEKRRSEQLALLLDVNKLIHIEKTASVPDAIAAGLSAEL